MLHFSHLLFVSDGFTYERHAILAWLRNGRNTSPMTNVPFTSTTSAPNFISNIILKMEIKKFLLKHSNPDPNVLA